VREIVRDDEVTVVVYIASRGDYKVHPSDLEYVVKFKSTCDFSQPLLLFDARRKVWVSVSPEDANIVVDRLKYDLFSALKNGEHQIVFRAPSERRHFFSPHILSSS